MKLTITIEDEEGTPLGKTEVGVYPDMPENMVPVSPSEFLAATEAIKQAARVKAGRWQPS